MISRKEVDEIHALVQGARKATETARLSEEKERKSLLREVVYPRLRAGKIRSSLACPNCGRFLYYGMVGFRLAKHPAYKCKGCGKVYRLSYRRD
jgi:transposase-like protein